mgnify:CR=1 FL=1
MGYKDLEHLPVKKSRITGGDIETIVDRGAVERISFVDIEILTKIYEGSVSKIEGNPNFEGFMSFNIDYEDGREAHLSSEFNYNPLSFQVLSQLLASHELYLANVSFQYSKHQARNNSDQIMIGDLYKSRTSKGKDIVFIETMGMLSKDK